MPNIQTRWFAAVLALSTVGFSGCAVFSNCGFSGCPGDKEITAEVRELFGDHPELGAPGVFQIQTLDGTVYLNGRVDTEMEKANAESIALQARNVKGVVNNLAVRNGKA